MVIKKQLKFVLLVLLSTQSRCSENGFKSVLASVSSIAKTATPYFISTGVGTLATYYATQRFSLNAKIATLSGFGLFGLGSTLEATRRFAPTTLNNLGTKLGLNLIKQETFAKISPFIIGTGLGITLAGTYWWYHVNSSDLRTPINNNNNNPDHSQTSTNTNFADKNPINSCVDNHSNGERAQSSSANNTNSNSRDNNSDETLHVSNQNPHIEIIELLEKKSQEQSSLIEAAKNGDYQTVRFLLTKNVNVNSADNNKRTALHWASHNNHKEIVQLLLDNGANVNLKDKIIVDEYKSEPIYQCHETALHLAIKNGHTEVVTLLLKSGADVNLKNFYNHTPLYLAKCNNHTEIIELLEKKSQEQSSLIKAAKNGDHQTVRFLLANNINVDCTDDSGFTALPVASENGHTKIVELLISRGRANVNLLNTDRNTALQLASKNGHTDIVTLLLKSGADVNFSNLWKSPPLYLASNNNHTEIVKLLTQKSQEQSLLIKAAKNGDYQTVESLLATNINVDCTDDSGFTALHVASENGHTEIVTLLLDRNANVDYLNIWNKYTALHVASKNGHTEIVKLLIYRGRANVNLESKNRSNSVNLAAQQLQITTPE